MHAPTRPSAVYPYFTIILARAVCGSAGLPRTAGERCDASLFPVRAVVLGMNCENEQDLRTAYERDSAYCKRHIAHVEREGNSKFREDKNIPKIFLNYQL